MTYGIRSGIAVAAIALASCGGGPSYSPTTPNMSESLDKYIRGIYS